MRQLGWEGGFCGGVGASGVCFTTLRRMICASNETGPPFFLSSHFFCFSASRLPSLIGDFARRLAGLLPVPATWTPRPGILAQMYYSKIFTFSGPDKSRSGAEIRLNVTLAWWGSGFSESFPPLSVCLRWLPSLAEVVLACRRQATGWGRRTHNQPYVFSVQRSSSVYYVQMAQRPHLLTFALRFSSRTPVHYACIIYCDLYLFLRNIFFSFPLFFIFTAQSIGISVLWIISCSAKVKANKINDMHSDPVCVRINM